MVKKISKGIKFRKADADPMKFLVGALIVIIVGILIMLIYKNMFNDIQKQNPVDLTKKDCDKDGLIDAVDPCICNDVEICKYGSDKEKADCREYTLNSCS